jgi:enamine deaminase RidA (YjgF/YER057c/UK114 family)
MAEIWYENPAGTAPAQGLYSQAGLSRGGVHAFVAGQLAVGPDGAVVGAGDFAAQFARVFENLGDVLAGIGGGWGSVAKFTTYLVHSQDIARFMTLRRELFPRLFPGGVYPPNTLLVVDRLVKEEFLLEVEAVAVVAERETQR